MADDERADASHVLLVDRYEQLRGHALDGDGQGWRLGLALLLRRGVAGWMRAWDDLPAASAGGHHRAAASRPDGGVDQPLVGALASMALACVAAR